MKAYRVHRRYAAHYEDLVEEIEVDRMTEKSYCQGSKMFRRLTEHHAVLATKGGAIIWVKQIAQDEISRVEMELHRLQLRLNKIKAMEAE